MPLGYIFRLGHFHPRGNHAISAKFLAAAVLTSVLSTPAFAATCNPPGGFDAFIAEFRRDAATTQGVSRKGTSALDGLAVDPSVLAADKRTGACSGRPSRNSPAA